MDNSILCFVAVEFPGDPNVVGLTYWYLSPFGGVNVGDGVVAPLGRHNGLQEGVVRAVRFAKEENAPYPVKLIKSIKKILTR